MLRPVCDPVALETPSSRLRVALTCRSCNTPGSIELSTVGAATPAPLAGGIRFRETLGVRRTRVLASERGLPFERAASAVKHVGGRAR